MNKGVIIGAIIVAAAIGGIALAGPLFYDTEVNEALPTSMDKMQDLSSALDDIQDGLTLEGFSNMEESSRDVLVDTMPEEVMDMIMEESAKIQTVVSEEMDTEPMILKTGMFAGLAGHEASGDAKIIDVSGTKYLRFENFEVTNGPDLRVYMTQDGDVKKGIHLEKLKGSKGAQNYLLEDIDTDSYDIVVIYCQPFGAYFGEARLG